MTGRIIIVAGCMRAKKGLCVAKFLEAGLLKVKGRDEKER